MTKPKKDFKDAAKRFISNAEPDTQEEHVTPSAPDTPNTHVTHDEPHTQGSRRQKYPRINMAFYGNNLEYLNLISRLEGVSITQYVNDLISEDEKKNREKVESMKSILKGR